MRTPTRRAAALVAFAGVMGLAGCSGSTPGQASSATPTMPSMTDMPASPSGTHTHSSATAVNGVVPPGSATKVAKSELLLKSTNSQGRQVLIYRDTRNAGTRTPIHTHPYGGSTCVLQGQMTLYLEGSAPQTAKAGQCYWMPSGLAMSGVNSGTTAAVFLDSFTVPAGEAVWDVIEPGKSAIADQFAK